MRVKHFIKNNLIGFIIGVIIAGSIGVFAYSYKANDILYTPKDNSWDVKTVQEAIDELKNDNKDISISGEMLRCNGEISSCSINDFESQKAYLCVITRRNTSVINISGDYELLYREVQADYLDGKSAEIDIIKSLSTSLTFTSQSSGMDVRCRNIY